MHDRQIPEINKCFMKYNQGYHSVYMPFVHFEDNYAKKKKKSLIYFNNMWGFCVCVVFDEEIYFKKSGHLEMNVCVINVLR